jgi:hypothetical protein
MLESEKECIGKTKQITFQQPVRHDEAASTKESHNASASLIWSQCRPQLHCLGDRRNAIHLAGTAQPIASRRPTPATHSAQLPVHWLGILGAGVVGPDLSSAFARPAAYGDLIAAVLALLALAGLHSRLGTVLVWVFNLWGGADLLYAFYQGNAVGLEPGQLGATYFIPTVVVPLLLITHWLVFRVLLQGSRYGRLE